MDELPLIDITSLIADQVPPAEVEPGWPQAPAPPNDTTSPRNSPAVSRLRVAEALDRACRTHGFFRVTGHGIDPTLIADLDRLARDFFARSDEEKADIAMAKAGTAWRGWFPVGAELTSGRPDHKEGLYLGTELADDDPRVVAGTPLHGPNLFPDEPAELGPAAVAYMNAVTRVGHAVMSGLALALGLPADWFADHLTAQPTILFRIFHYPPVPGQPPVPGPPPDLTPSPANGPNPDGEAEPLDWGVSEHTDYGLLTLLTQDDRGGLEVRVDDRWVSVPAEPGVIVCNLGDMLEALTGGRYRSTLHRVRNTSGVDRLSFPLFFDPSWDARVRPLPIGADTPAATAHRWDGADPAAWTGTYGEYLTAKVSRVFPELFATLKG